MVQLVWRQEWEEEDKLNEISEEEITINAIVEIFSYIYKDLQFTGGLPNDHPNNRCPMPDFKSWVIKTKT